MIAHLVREPSVDHTTFGRVLIDGQFLCYSLEDEIREQPGRPVAEWKVPGQTAIPAGRYRLALTFSPRFKRVLPEVLDVPGFDGIRIHSGNRHADTAGCVLLGLQRTDDRLLESRMACEAFQTYLDAALSQGAPAFLLIENPPGFSGVTP